MKSKLPRLANLGHIDLPVVEASGLATMHRNGRLHVLVVGDRTAHVGVGSDASADGVESWRLTDLSELDGWELPPTDIQMEAIAVDGGRHVALMREDPPVVIVADTSDGRIVSTISLRVPADIPNSVDWGDPSSRGEGLVLLRGGRLLVAKEKRPAALIEFAPAGAASAGISSADFLADGETWESPTGDVEFVATAVWRLTGRAKKTFRDISDLEVGRDRSLWLLSDQSATVGRLWLERPLPAGGGKIDRVDDAWRLPKGTEKPEGLVAFGEGRGLVALDTKHARSNGMIVGPPD